VDKDNVRVGQEPESAPSERRHSLGLGIVSTDRVYPLVLEDDVVLARLLQVVFGPVVEVIIFLQTEKNI